MSRTFLRRNFLKNGIVVTAAAGAGILRPSYLWAQAGSPTSASVGGRAVVDLSIQKHKIPIAGGTGTVVSVNRTVPAPLLRFREGQELTINVKNEMTDESTSIHWHGLLVPWDMDGVPGVSFAGIPARQTFTYRFKLRQSGTYWYHSHTGPQEQVGLYGPLIIDPIEPEPYKYDRDYVVLLSDWTFEDPVRVMDRLKNMPTYYNFQQRTAVDFFRDVKQHGWRATLADRLMWGRMRMSATDILDVTGYRYTYLINGLMSEENWTGLFRPGERLRLRFINAGAMTIFDVRIPGLKMTVVHADGQDVEPVELDQILQNCVNGDCPVVVDVRETWEYRQGHIPGAVLIPLGQLSSRLNELNPERPVAVICASGSRSQSAAALLGQKGFKTVFNVSGGTGAWQYSGLALERP